MQVAMTSKEICCNPFKERNHNPEPWKLLPVTESLREQFRLYLDEDTDICISCKRKLYMTLPSFESEEYEDSLTEELEESILGMEDRRPKTRESRDVSYVTDKTYATWHSAKERPAKFRESNEAKESKKNSRTLSTVPPTRGIPSPDPNFEMDPTENDTSW